MVNSPSLVRHHGLLTLIAGVGILLLPEFLPAQQQPPSTAPASGEALIRLDFPEDGIEIKTLADIVTRRLGIPILYDEQVANKKVVIRVPREVPESALMGVFQSALRMKS